MDAQAITPQIIGKRYLLHEQLGQGGMGVVYRATDRLTQRDVALKRVNSTSADLEFSSTGSATDFRLALAREFKLTSTMRHPNIVEVLDYGFDEASQPYFTMELLENPVTVLDYAQTCTLEEKIRLVAQILTALAYIHRRGLLHRDLKPANVLVTDGQVKVLDFGLSTMHSHSKDDSLEDISTAGTLAYMPPEVLVGGEADIPADLYAVGVMGYEFIADKHPFTVSNPAQLINDVLYAVPDMSTLDIPFEMEMVFERLLQKEPDSRYDSAQAVLEAIELATGLSLELETSASRDSFLQAARLIGRDYEMGLLSDALKYLFREQGSTWLIAGESGVGKSRLMDEIRTRAMVAGALVVRGQALNIGSRPYEIWRPLLRWLCLWQKEWNNDDIAMFKTLIPDMGDVIQQNIDHIAPKKASPEAVQARIITMLEQTLHVLGQKVVLLLEDLHWAGSESLKMLEQMVQMVQRLPIMVIGSYRQDESPQLKARFPDVSHIQLERLDELHIAELSVAMLGEAGRRPQVISLLQRETEGNIFFLIEVVRALVEDTGQLDDIGRMTLPERVFSGGINSVVQHRLSKIGKKGQALLRIAAVMGRQVDTQLLGHVVPSGITLNRWLSDCSDAAILEVDDDQWRFTHDKLREGILQDVSLAEKAALHQQVASALEAIHGTDSAYVNALAYHWGQAGEQEKEVHYLDLSGVQLLQNGAYKEAIDAFERVLHLLPKLSLSDDALNRRQILVKQQQAQAHLGFADYDSAQSLYQQALTTSQTIHADDLRASSLGYLGDVAYALGQWEEAQRLYQNSLEIYHTINDQAGITRTLNSLGNVAYELDDQETAKRYYQESLVLAREIGEEWGMAGAVRTQSMPVITANHADLNNARAMLEKTLASHTEEGNRHGIASALFNLGETAVKEGDYETALKHFEEAARMRRNLEDVEGLAQVLEHLGQVNTLHGDYQAAWTNLREALSSVTAIDNRAMGTHILMRIAHLLIAEEKHSDALELLAYLLYSPESGETLQDQAEQLIFDVEDQLDPDKVEMVWESGKSKTYDQVIKQYTK